MQTFENLRKMQGDLQKPKESQQKPRENLQKPKENLAQSLQGLSVSHSRQQQPSDGPWLDSGWRDLVRAGCSPGALGQRSASEVAGISMCSCSARHLLLIKGPRNSYDFLGIPWNS